jgi:hypothetical protein
MKPGCVSRAGTVRSFIQQFRNGRGQDMNTTSDLVRCCNCRGAPNVPPCIYKLLEEDLSDDDVIRVTKLDRKEDLRLFGVLRADPHALI